MGTVWAWGTSPQEGRPMIVLTVFAVGFTAIEVVRRVLEGRQYRADMKRKANR